MIQLTQISKKYGKKHVLSEISMTFEAGKVYGIVGENGAGKTTLFRCIAGFETHEGTIHSDLNPLKNHLGFLFTEPHFFDRITGREYVQLLCNARKIKLEQLATKNVFELPLNQYVSTYSTGMKKKLAIFALLLQENSYFILDEPFNGLDFQSTVLVEEIILKLKELKKTVILSSHVFSTLKKTCDEILILEQGKVNRTIAKNDFDALESELVGKILEDKIHKLQLK